MAPTRVLVPLHPDRLAHQPLRNLNRRLAKVGVYWWWLSPVWFGLACWMWAVQLPQPVGQCPALERRFDQLEERSGGHQHVAIPVLPFVFQERVVRR